MRVQTYATGRAEWARFRSSSSRASCFSWPFFGLADRLGIANGVRAALAAALLLVTAASLARVLARAAAHRDRLLRQRTLIVGSGSVANGLAERLSVHHEFGLDPVGYVDDDAHETGVFGLPQLGGLSALPDLIELLRVDRVIIAFSRATHDELLHCLSVCRDSGVAVDVVPRLFEFLYGARALSHVGGMPLLSLDMPNLSRLSRACKRAVDVIGATLILLALLPIMAFVAIVIKLDTRGPVFFVQQRAGRGAASLSSTSSVRCVPAPPVLVRDDGAIVKTPDDDRITRVGTVIRRLSLDETPQLLNVLRGDMSLVGPRPLPEHAWQTLPCRTTPAGEIVEGRVAFVRVAAAHPVTRDHRPARWEWLIIEWPDGHDAPSDYWLANLPDDTSRERLARLARLRWTIELDYRQLKGELGLDHYEGRSYPGFHHHCALVTCAHAFLTLERTCPKARRPV